VPEREPLQQRRRRPGMRVRLEFLRSERVVSPGGGFVSSTPHIHAVYSGSRSAATENGARPRRDYPLPGLRGPRARIVGRIRKIGFADDDVFSLQRHQDSLPGWRRCRRAVSAVVAPSSTSPTRRCQNSPPYRTPRRARDPRRANPGVSTRNRGVRRGRAGSARSGGDGPRRTRLLHGLRRRRPSGGVVHERDIPADGHRRNKR
jgi:hypothetical protein